MVSLKTSRLVLRPFQKSDLPAFADYRSDPEVARYQSWTAPYALAQAEAYLRELEQTTPGTPGEWYALAVERQSVPGIIGDCAFQVMAYDSLQIQV